MINPSMTGLEKIKATLQYLGSQPNGKAVLQDLWQGTNNSRYFVDPNSARSLVTAARQPAAAAPAPAPAQAAQGAPQFTPYMQPPSYWQQALPYAQWGQQYQMPSMYTRPPQLGMGGGVPGLSGLLGIFG